MNYSFLITYFAQPELLEICLDSIRKHHPGANIIVSQEENDDSVDIGDARLIRHNMARSVWSEAAKGLMAANDRQIGIFIEHDCFLLRNIDDLIAKIGEYDMIGPEEVIPGLRDSPGMICQNFFIVDTDNFKNNIGIDKVYIHYNDPSEVANLKNKESGYGISQESKKKLFLPVTPSGYAYGTYYGDAVHHLWYGSYRKRPVEHDGVNKLWMEESVKELIKDYKNGEIRGVHPGV